MRGQSSLTGLETKGPRTFCTHRADPRMGDRRDQQDIPFTIKRQGVAQLGAILFRFAFEAYDLRLDPPSPRPLGPADLRPRRFRCVEISSALSPSASLCPMPRRKTSGYDLQTRGRKAEKDPCHVHHSAF